MEILFKLVKVYILEYRIHDEVTEFVHGTPVQIDLGTSIGADGSKSQVILILHGKYRLDQTSLLDFKFQFSYEIANFKDAIQLHENSQMTVDENLIQYLIGNVIDTARGIIIAKNLGTPIADVYIPPVTSQSILPGMQLRGKSNQ